MQKVFSLGIVGLCVLGLTLSAGAQQSQQPGKTESQQMQTSGTSAMQQNGAQSISFTITKIDKDARQVSMKTEQGTEIEVSFPEAESAEAKDLMQKLQEGKTLTAQVSRAGATQAQAGTAGASGSQQEGSTAKMPQEGTEGVRAIVTKVDESTGTVELLLSPTQVEANTGGLKSGDTVTIQLGSTPGTMEKGGTTGTGGTMQQQQGQQQKQESSPKKQ